MQSSATAALGVNDLRALVPSLGPWTLKRRLSQTRESNPRTSTGAGARRRAAYEHQLDDFTAILGACETQGAVIAVDRSARLRRSAEARLRARATTRILSAQAMEPFGMIRAALAQRDSYAAAVARTVVQLLDRCKRNAPTVAGWALAQSVERTSDNPSATRFYIPRRSWSAFVIYRQWVRGLVRLLWLLYALLSRPIPLRRGLSPEAKPKETGPTVGRESRAVTTLGDRNSAAEDAAWLRARPFPGA